MRCNWRRWLWGVIPLVALALAAAQLERPAMEQDLTERARHALGAKGAHWAVVNFSGRDVVLTGNAISDNEPREAVAVLRSLWGVGKVKNGAGLPKLVEPYVWKAYRRGNRVRLKGYYPNRAMRQTIVGMTRASLPGLEVVDRMRGARGVPPTDTWLAGVSFALKQLASLKRGDVHLEGLALTITGEAENADAYRAVTAALKRGLPKGVTLASVEIAAPVVSPFTWSAEFAGGQLALSGYATSEGARTELLGVARVAAGTVVDRMEVARGAPSGSAEAAAALIKEIVRLQSGSAQMKDAAVVVGGVAADNAQAQAVRDGLRASLPAGFKLTDQIRVREPKVEPKAETKPAEQLAPAGPTGEKDAASAKPPAPAEKKDATSAASSAPAEKKDTASAASSPPAEKKDAASAEAPAPAEKAKDTALLTPPVAAPQPPAEAKSAAPPSFAPETAPPAPAEKSAPATEAEPKAGLAPLAKAEPAPPPKVEPAPPPKAVDLAVCRSDLTRLAAANPVLFDRGSAEIETASLKALGAIVQAVKACPGVRIVAEGHTDTEGSSEFNQRLSLKRANAVAEYLIEAGVAADLVQTAGLGTSRPVAPNTSAHTRAKNRRTEIVVRP
ncbi:MAG: OmpA family protein [Hyphomicrobiaceae bacterium]